MYHTTHCTTIIHTGKHTQTYTYTYTPVVNVEKPTPVPPDSAPFYQSYKAGSLHLDEIVNSTSYKQKTINSISEILTKITMNNLRRV